MSFRLSRILHGTRLFVVAAAAVFVFIGFTSPAVAVTLSEGKRIPSPGWDPKAVTNDRGVLITSGLAGPSTRILLDFVPLLGEPTRHIVAPSLNAHSLATGSNGREFLMAYLEVELFPVGPPLGYGILLDPAGVPTRTVKLPPVPGRPSSSVVLATAEGFDVYIEHDKSLLRTSVHLDGTSSETWQTAASFDKEIGFFDVLNLADGKVLIYLVEEDLCRLCVCETRYFPVHAAVTSRDDAVDQSEYSVLPGVTGNPHAEVGTGGRIWFLGEPGLQWGGQSPVTELIVAPDGRISQSRVLASDTDGAGYEYYFEWLIRLGGGFVLTERTPGGSVASLRTGDGYEWERLSVGQVVIYAVPGPGEYASFVLYNWHEQQTYVRFLSLGRTRGASPKSGRVRPSRPE